VPHRPLPATQHPNVFFDRAVARAQHIILRVPAIGHPLQALPIEEGMLLGGVRSHRWRDERRALQNCVAETSTNVTTAGSPARAPMDTSTSHSTTRPTSAMAAAVAPMHSGV